jgi:phenylalanyl-tRNA synthetase beta chain
VRVPLSWLRELVAVDLGVDELGDLLSGKGMHVEAIERPWAGLEGVIVGLVVDVRDHPDSDKLCIARVQTGSGEQEVVVGVRNMGPGDLVPLAAPGARVPTLPDPLEARRIRGVESNGMLCSPQELAISQDHGGILVLSDDGLEPGADLKTSLGLDEVVLDLEIESNRPDLLSIAGIAREVAAATGSALIRPDTHVDEVDSEAADAASVRVDAPDGCPRYLARVIRSVAVAPSPIRIQARLTAAGVRPLSNVVDATNLVMLELGQPLHAFDLHRLAGSEIVVRRASPGERMTTLDDVERTFEEGDLLICDHDHPIGIAGIMGGASTEVSAGTSDVLLEAAYFEPRGIHRTSRRLLLSTEAATRFSRGADPEAPGPATARAAQLMGAWAGGKVLRGAIDVGGAPPRRHLSVRPARAAAIAGHDISATDVVDALGSLEIEAAPSSEAVEAEIPSFRPDLIAEVDLIEEVIRVQGYERVGSTVPRGAEPGSYDHGFVVRATVRERLVRAGVREALSLSFASQSDLDLFGHADAVRVANPPASETPFLRTSLVPNLVRGIARSLRRGASGAALFEVGNVFRLGDPVREREMVTVAVGGRTGAGLWEEDRPYDVLDAKGPLESLLEGLGVLGWTLGDVPGRPFHPARSREVIVDQIRAGVVGELHPAALRQFDLEERVGVFEVDLGVLGDAGAGTFAFRDVPRYPPIRRDLAFIVPDVTAAGEVLQAIEASAGPLLDRCVLFDVFLGGALPTGTKSLAFALDLRSPDRTLETEEADAVVDTIVRVLGERFEAILRSG